MAVGFNAAGIANAVSGMHERARSSAMGRAQMVQNTQFKIMDQLHRNQQITLQNRRLMLDEEERKRRYDLDIRKQDNTERQQDRIFGQNESKLKMSRIAMGNQLMKTHNDRMDEYFDAAFPAPQKGNPQKKNSKLISLPGGGGKAVRDLNTGRVLAAKLQYGRLGKATDKMGEIAAQVASGDFESAVRNMGIYNSLVLRGVPEGTKARKTRQLTEAMTGVKTHDPVVMARSAVKVLDPSAIDKAQPIEAMTENDRNRVEKFQQELVKGRDRDWNTFIPDLTMKHFDSLPSEKKLELATMGIAGGMRAIEVLDNRLVQASEAGYEKLKAAFSGKFAMGIQQDLTQLSQQDPVKLVQTVLGGNMEYLQSFARAKSGSGAAAATLLHMNELAYEASRNPEAKQQLRGVVAEFLQTRLLNSGIKGMNEQAVSFAFQEAFMNNGMDSQHPAMVTLNGITEMVSQAAGANRQLLQQSSQQFVQQLTKDELGYFNLKAHNEHRAAGPKVKDEKDKNDMVLGTSVKTWDDIENAALSSIFGLGDDPLGGGPMTGGQSTRQSPAMTGKVNRYQGASEQNRQNNMDGAKGLLDLQRKVYDGYSNGGEIRDIGGEYMLTRSGKIDYFERYLIDHDQYNTHGGTDTGQGIKVPRMPMLNAQSPAVTFPSRYGEKEGLTSLGMLNRLYKQDGIYNQNAKEIDALVRKGDQKGLKKFLQDRGGMLPETILTLARAEQANASANGQHMVGAAYEQFLGQHGYLDREREMKRAESIKSRGLKYAGGNIPGASKEMTAHMANQVRDLRTAFNRTVSLAESGAADDRFRKRLAQENAVAYGVNAEMKRMPEKSIAEGLGDGFTRVAGFTIGGALGLVDTINTLVYGTYNKTMPGPDVHLPNLQDGFTEKLVEWNRKTREEFKDFNDRYDANVSRQVGQAGGVFMDSMRSFGEVEDTNAVEYLGTGLAAAWENGKSIFKILDALSSSDPGADPQPMVAGRGKSTR